MISAAVAKRLAGVEAALDAIAPKPKPGSYEAVIAENPWIEWTSTDELIELEQIYRKDEDGEATAADEARGLAIAYAAEARRLAGEPAEDEKASPYVER